MLADPSWKFKVYGKNGLKKSPDRHYVTIPLPEMISLPVKSIVAKDALMIMWVYDPMLPEALMLAEAWGFKFVTVFNYWNKLTASGKQCFGTGYHTRAGGTEMCWLFKRGKGLRVLNHSVPRTFSSVRREHSRKPNNVHDAIELMYGDFPRVELFSRQRRDGWVTWGDQTEFFQK